MAKSIGNNDSIEPLFKALSDQTRLRVIHLIGDDEICVCFFVQVLKTNQPKISRHLAYLRRAGVVTSRRDGKWRHYRLVEPADTQAAKIFREVREWLASNPKMQKDKLILEALRLPTLHGPLRTRTSESTRPNVR